MKWYKIVFKQVQPIHIGMGSYGVINETRIFIPGWTMWGALTKTYNLQNGGDLSANQNLFENISCFYPCFDPEGKDVLWPNFENGEFYLGDYSERKFRAKFVDTFVSTAVIPDGRAAKEESLHEINFILRGVDANSCKDSDKKKENQFYWVGVIEFKDEYYDRVKDFLTEGLEIFVGGDVKYGFGLMSLVKKEELQEKDFKRWKISKEKRLANYLDSRVLKNDIATLKKVNTLSTYLEFEGKIELIVNIKPSRGADLQIEDKRFCIMPGSKLDIEDDLIDKLELKKGVFINHLQ